MNKKTTFRLGPVGSLDKLPRRQRDGNTGIRFGSLGYYQYSLGLNSLLKQDFSRRRYFICYRKTEGHKTGNRPSFTQKGWFIFKKCYSPLFCEFRTIPWLRLFRRSDYHSMTSVIPEPPPEKVSVSKTPEPESPVAWLTDTVITLLLELVLRVK